MVIWCNFLDMFEGYPDGHISIADGGEELELFGMLSAEDQVLGFIYAGF